ncbi:MAG: acyl-CoA dehydrogenase family protein, partial [bacterium]
TFADQITLAARTAKGAGYKGISLFIVEKKMPGFSVGKKLKKMGCHASGTAELIFEDVRVPKENLLGEEGKGFYGIVKNFEEERLVAALGNVVRAQTALDMAVEYAKSRVAFGQPISKFQVISHRVAEMATEIEAARQLTYYCLAKFNAGEDCRREIAMSKYYTAELVNRVCYQATQIFGGYGYMREYPIERFYRDARMSTIAGGTTEIMKEIIVRTMGL